MASHQGQIVSHPGHTASHQGGSANIQEDTTTHQDHTSSKLEGTANSNLGNMGDTIYCSTANILEVTDNKEDNPTTLVHRFL